MSEKNRVISAIDGSSVLIAAHVAGLRFDDLSDDVLRSFKRALVDYLACSIAGASMPVSESLRQYFVDEDPAHHATVVGTSIRLSAQNAAFVNGAHTHGLDFDDGYTQGSAHPAGVIFPAVMAAAERHQAGSQEIVTAVVCGYDVMLRVAATMHPVTARRGFHNTALAGVFGAAAGVASILKLNVDQTLHALGLASSFAGGIREYLQDGAEVKRMHPGKAARDGLVCAELAARGITGPHLVFEGRMGFFNTFANGDIRAEKLLQDLGQKFTISEIYFKPYPCCRHYHAAIDAVRALKAVHQFGAGDIVSGRIGLYGVGVLGHGHQKVHNLLEAQMSAPCAVALAIEDGNVTGLAFDERSISRPELRNLMMKLTTEVDAECESIYPSIRSGIVELSLKNGKQIYERVLRPKGESDNPMSDADLEQKFLANTEGLIGRNRARDIVRSIWNFESNGDRENRFFGLPTEAVQ